MYDFTLGRFVQRDPFGYTDGKDLYEYAKSNPRRFADPNGTAAHDDKVVKNLIEQLGDDKFATREAATRALELRVFADPQVKKVLEAYRSPDLEVTRRIERILEKASEFEKAIEDPQQLRPILRRLCDCLASRNETEKDLAKATISRVIQGIPRDDLSRAIPILNVVYCSLKECLKNENARKEAGTLLVGISGRGGLIDDLKKHIARTLLGLDEKIIEDAQLDFEKKVKDCK